MTAQDTLNRIFDTDWQAASVSVCLASLPRDADLPELRGLNMTDDLADEFRRIVRAIADRLRELDDAGDLVLRPFDAGYKPDDHDVEWLKLAEVQSVVDTIECVPDPVANASLFDGDNEFARSLHFYAIAVEPPRGKRLLFFRKYSPQREVSRSRFFAALFAEGQYDTIRKPLFLFDDRIDCFAMDGHIFVLHKHDFQLIFRFFELLREVADEALEQIREHVPIANFDDFAESCRGHLQKLGKLKNIASRPYLQHVRMADLKRTIKTFELNGVKVVRRNGREMLEFDPANRWEILKLLDDDYLGSVMTKLKYEVNSKRAL